MKDALLATVIDETAAVQAFESLLVHEEKALIAASPLDTLPSIIEQKTALTEQLAALERQRDEQLDALGLPKGFIGMEQAVTGHEALASRWQELLAARVASVQVISMIVCIAGVDCFVERQSRLT